LRTDRPTDRPTDFSFFGPYWGNFKWPYLRDGSSDPLHVWFYGGVFGVGGSNGAISGFAKSKMAARPPSWKIQMAISLRRIVRFTSCLVLRWGFRGRGIEWRYFRFRQIQDGGSAAILENSYGDISVADRPIYFVFGSRMGFSGSADRMALFPVSLNPRWRLGRHLGKFKWRYLRDGSSDLLRVWFYDGVFVVGGSNGANSFFDYIQ